VPRVRRRHRFELNAEINVVSLIDVMLLLLVIFMITAPMMQGGVDIALPKADAKPIESKSGLVVTISKSGEIRMDDQPFSLQQFRVAFKSLAGTRGKDGVYLRADKGVDYGTVVQVFSIMNAAGVGSIGLMAEPETIIR
jgi:biopolymer transport protein ExbD/biopolymer transport protein TolR